MLEKGQI